MKYKIGDVVWWARFETTETSIECPDCAGDSFIRCIMGDGTEVTVDCGNCHVGYEEFSRGRVRTCDRVPFAATTTIIGMDVKLNSVEYRIPQSYIVCEDDLWDTEEAALDRAKVKAVEAGEEELARIKRKEKDTRSWAWNATYHRRCIRNAERDIEYHSKKLDVAGEKAKAAKAKDKS